MISSKDSEKSTGTGQQDECNYERESYLLERRRFNIEYPFGVGALFFAAIGAGMLIWQTMLTRQTLEDTRSELKAAQRAYVSFGSKTGILAEFDSSGSTIQGKPVFAVHFTNGGQSTARHLSVQVHTTAENKSFQFAHRHRMRGRQGEMVTSMIIDESDLAAQAERVDYISRGQRNTQIASDLGASVDKVATCHGPEVTGNRQKT